MGSVFSKRSDVYELSSSRHGHCLCIPSTELDNLGFLVCNIYTYPAAKPEYLLREVDWENGSLPAGNWFQILRRLTPHCASNEDSKDERKVEQSKDEMRAPRVSVNSVEDAEGLEKKKRWVEENDGKKELVKELKERLQRLSVECSQTDKINETPINQEFSDDVDTRPQTADIKISSTEEPKTNEETNEEPPFRSAIHEPSPSKKPQAVTPTPVINQSPATVQVAAPNRQRPSRRTRSQQSIEDEFNATPIPMEHKKKKSNKVTQSALPAARAKRTPGRPRKSPKPKGRPKKSLIESKEEEDICTTDGSTQVPASPAMECHTPQLLRRNTTSLEPSMSRMSRTTRSGVRF